jgi:hypothetical protein
VHSGIRFRRLPCRADSRTRCAPFPLLLPSLYALIHVSLSIKRDRFVRAHSAVQRDKSRGTREALEGHSVRHPQPTQFRPLPLRPPLRPIPFRPNASVVRLVALPSGCVQNLGMGAGAGPAAPALAREYNHYATQRTTSIIERNAQCATRKRTRCNNCADNAHVRAVLYAARCVMFVSLSAPTHALR